MSDAKDEPTASKVLKLSSEATPKADSNFLDKTQKILEDIDSCQNEIDSLNEKASEEILKIEQKYNTLRKPHFDKRNELISSLPNFWVTTFINHPQLGAILAEEEEQCLRYLKQMYVEEYEDIKSGYKISFTFAKNPYFTNDVLVKEFHLSTSTGTPRSTSTPVKWNDNMDLSEKSKLSPRAKKRKRGQGSSFFSWYKSSTDPTTDELAEVLKDDIWPNPLQYYLSPEANGISDSSSDESDGEMDDSVVVVGDDDDDDDDDVYAVDHDSDDDDGDDDDLSDFDVIGNTAGDSIEVVDDDDDDEVEVISDVEEIIDTSKDVGDTTNELEVTQESVDESMDHLLDDTADDTVDEPDDAILDDTADASIETSLDQTTGDIDDAKDTSKDVSQDKEESVEKEVAALEDCGDVGAGVDKTETDLKDKSEEDMVKDGTGGGGEMKRKGMGEGSEAILLKLGVECSGNVQDSI